MLIDVGSMAATWRRACVKCGRPARELWSVCALGRDLPLCAACDRALNALILRWAGIRAWRATIRRYAAAQRRKLARTRSLFRRIGVTW